MKLIIFILSIYMFNSISMCSSNPDFCKKINSLDEPLTNCFNKKGILHVFIAKHNNLNKMDSSNAVTYDLQNNKIIRFKDSAPFAITLTINYDSAQNYPSYIHAFSDISQEFTTLNKPDLKNNKFVCYWKDEFKEIIDSSSYFFNQNGYVKQIDNNLDFFNYYIRKKLAYGVFNVNFNESFKYENDSFLVEKKILYNVSASRLDLKKIFPLTSVVYYKYDEKNNLISIVEHYYFQDKKQNINKEIFFKEGLPYYHIINNKEKWFYSYK